MSINKMLLAICTISLLATSIKSVAQQPTNTPEPRSIKASSGALAKQSPTSLPTPSQNILTLNDTRAVPETKKETDWLTIVISLLSLAVSSVVAYTSSFKQANIQLCFGRNIILFPVTKINVTTSGITIAGVGFNLPITFYNWSPQGGTIQRIRLVVSKQNHNDFYDMTWTTFVKIGSAGNFEDDNLAQPIAVKGLSSINQVIRFDWINELGGNIFDLKAGNYELRIYGWTKNTEKPNLRYKNSFSLKEEDYRIFKDSVAANLSRAIWVSLDENEKPNQLVSRNTIDRLYSE
jgi:hypothetical protein